MEKETPTNGWKCGDCGEEIEVTPLTFVNPHICKETPKAMGIPPTVWQDKVLEELPPETPTEEWAKKKV